MASGTVASVDLLHDELRVDITLWSTRTFLVDDATRITDGRRPLRLGQVRPGDEVRIQYVKEQGDRLATSIEVGAAATH